MNYLETKVGLKNRSKVMFFLVTDAKWNDMTKEIVEYLGLTMQKKPKLEFFSYTYQSYSISSL